MNYTTDISRDFVIKEVNYAAAQTHKSKSINLSNPPSLYSKTKGFIQRFLSGIDFFSTLLPLSPNTLVLVKQAHTHQLPEYALMKTLAQLWEEKKRKQESQDRKDKRWAAVSRREPSARQSQPGESHEIVDISNPLHEFPMSENHRNLNLNVNRPILKSGDFVERFGFVPVQVKELTGVIVKPFKQSKLPCPQNGPEIVGHAIRQEGNHTDHVAQYTKDRLWNQAINLKTFAQKTHDRLVERSQFRTKILQSLDMNATSAEALQAQNLTHRERKTFHEQAKSKLTTSLSSEGLDLHDLPLRRSYLIHGLEAFHYSTKSPLESEYVDKPYLKEIPVVYGSLEIENIRRERLKQAYLDNWKKYSNDERQATIAERERRKESAKKDPVQVEASQSSGSKKSGSKHISKPKKSSSLSEAANSKKKTPTMKFSAGIVHHNPARLQYVAQKYE